MSLFVSATKNPANSTNTRFSESNSLALKMWWIAVPSCFVLLLAASLSLYCVAVKKRSCFRPSDAYDITSSGAHGGVTVMSEMAHGGGLGANSFNNCHALSNSDVTVSGVLGNSDVIGSSVLGNSDETVSGVLGNSDVIGSSVLDNSDVTVSGVLGNNDVTGPGVLGNGGAKVSGNSSISKTIV